MGKERAIKSISFCNSEGFWGEDGDYLSLNNKHNFQASHLGAVLGILRDGLQVRGPLTSELTVCAAVLYAVCTCSHSWEAVATGCKLFGGWQLTYSWCSTCVSTVFTCMLFLMRLSAHHDQMMRITISVHMYAASHVSVSTSPSNDVRRS